MQCGATIGPCPRRYADGVSPTISRKVRLNVPRLVKPTSRQMSVTLRSVSRKEEHRALNPATLEVPMRRLTEDRAEGADEVGLRDVGHRGHGPDVD